MYSEIFMRSSSPPKIKWSLRKVQFLKLYKLLSWSFIYICWLRIINDLSVQKTLLHVSRQSQGQYLVQVHVISYINTNLLSYSNLYIPMYLIIQSKLKFLISVFSKSIGTQSPCTKIIHHDNAIFLPNIHACTSESSHITISLE